MQVWDVIFSPNVILHPTDALYKLAIKIWEVHTSVKHLLFPDVTGKARTMCFAYNVEIEPRFRGQLAVVVLVTDEVTLESVPRKHWVSVGLSYGV